jgi:hypothetical protein
MKKLIYLLLFISLNCAAQHNIISTTYQILDNGFGMRYDRLINNSGIYVSVVKGNYNLSSGSVSHFKSAVGVSRKLNPRIEANPYISIGIAYNRYWGEAEGISDKAFKPVSIELGINKNIRWLNIGVRYDPLKKEATIDLGILL